MKRKLLFIFFSFGIILSLFPLSALAAETAFTDTSGHWAADAIEKWAGYDVLKGADGQFRPDDPITRAELAAVLNRVIGYTEITNTAFADVPSDAWYYSDVAKLYAAGIMLGDGDCVMRPESNITREEAVVLIARAFDVPKKAGNENPFPDDADISVWASFLVDGMKAAGYISGDTAGNFNPKAGITRAEVVTILNNMITLYFNTAVVHNCELIGEIDANALINTAGATVQNLTINGNLWITEGVGIGTVMLDNVTVSGTTYIRGGGPNSIHVTGGSFGEIRLDADTNPTLKLSNETEVGRIYLDNTGTAAHNGVTISYDATTSTITLAGAIDKVELNADGTATVTIGGSVYDIIPPEGTEWKFELAKDAVVKELVLDVGVTISGTGKIEKASVTADGVVVEKSVNVKPESITVAEGVHITIGGKNYIGTGTTLPPVSSGGGPPPATVNLTGVSFTPPDAVAVGDELTAAAVPANATNVSYQWYVSNSDAVITEPDQAELIAGATSATFMVTDAQKNKYIYVAVTGENSVVKVSGKTLKVSAKEDEPAPWIMSFTLHELRDITCELHEGVEIVAYDGLGTRETYTIDGYVLKDLLAELGAEMDKINSASELFFTDLDNNSVSIPSALIVDSSSFIALDVNDSDATAPRLFPAPNLVDPVNGDGVVVITGTFVDASLCKENIVKFSLIY